MARTTGCIPAAAWPSSAVFSAAASAPAKAPSSATSMKACRASVDSGGRNLSSTAQVTLAVPGATVAAIPSSARRP